MKKNIIVMGVFFAVSANAPAAWAKAAHIAEAQARKSNAAVNTCAQTTQGQALVDCVANAMFSFGTGLNDKAVTRLAPSAPNLASQAAEISGKPKAQAAQALSRVLAVSRSLAGKNTGEVQRVYNAVAGAFSVALAVVERKG